MGTFSSLSPILIHCHFICRFNFSNTIDNIVSLKVGGEAELKTSFH
jgi:methionine synthase II (cobalamin-independent)